MTIKERMAACQLFTDEDANYPEEAAELAARRASASAGKSTACILTILKPA